MIPYSRVSFSVAQTLSFFFLKQHLAVEETRAAVMKKANTLWNDLILFIVLFGFFSESQ